MITNQIWFAGNECIGIVQIVQEHDREAYRQTGNADFKYYIGVGQGQNEKQMLNTLPTAEYLLIR